MRLDENLGRKMISLRDSGISLKELFAFLASKSSGAA